MGAPEVGDHLADGAPRMRPSLPLSLQRTHKKYRVNCPVFLLEFWRRATSRLRVEFRIIPQIAYFVNRQMSQGSRGRAPAISCNITT